MVLVLPRHPQELDVILGSAGGDGAIRLAKTAHPSLAGQTLLRANGRTLNSIPDLAGGTGLWNDTGFRRSGCLFCERRRDA